VVYVGSVDELYALIASSGVLLWHSGINLVLSSATVVNGMVFFGAPDYKVYAFHLPN
jgi:outer membrane protein assembly factor BamB